MMPASFCFDCGEELADSNMACPRCLPNWVTQSGRKIQGGYQAAGGAEKPWAPDTGSGVMAGAHAPALRAERVPNGWGLVPVEPTYGMVRVAAKMFDDMLPHSEWPFSANLYRTMVAEAPTPPSLDAAPEPPASPAERKVAWLLRCCDKAGKGTLDGVDARAVKRITDRLARRVAEVEAERDKEAQFADEIGRQRDALERRLAEALEVLEAAASDLLALAAGMHRSKWSYEDTPAPEGSVRPFDFLYSMGDQAKAAEKRARDFIRRASKEGE